MSDKDDKKKGMSTGTLLAIIIPIVIILFLILIFLGGDIVFFLPALTAFMN